MRPGTLEPESPQLLDGVGTEYLNPDQQDNKTAQDLEIELLLIEKIDDKESPLEFWIEATSYLGCINWE